MEVVERPAVSLLTTSSGATVYVGHEGFDQQATRLKSMLIDWVLAVSGSSIKADAHQAMRRLSLVVDRAHYVSIGIDADGREEGSYFADTYLFEVELPVDSSMFYRPRLRLTGNLSRSNFVRRQVRRWIQHIAIRPARNVAIADLMQLAMRLNLIQNLAIGVEVHYPDGDSLAIETFTFNVEISQ